MEELDICKETLFGVLVSVFTIVRKIIRVCFFQTFLVKRQTESREVVCEMKSTRAKKLENFAFLEFIILASWPNQRKRGNLTYLLTL